MRYLGKHEPGIHARSAAFEPCLSTPRLLPLYHAATRARAGTMSGVEGSEAVAGQGRGGADIRRESDAPDVSGRPRMNTLDAAIIHPGTVHVNVQGAFIVDDESDTDIGTPNRIRGAGDSSPPSAEGRHDTKSIRLPNHTALVSHIAVDLGGSLAKVVYFSREAESREPGGRLHFTNFESDRIDECLEFMRQLKLNQPHLNGSRSEELCVMATGGGAYKYYDKLREALGVEVIREDEMECLIIGLDFFISEIPNEVFTHTDADPMQFQQPSANVYPYLLVNIGSGVSMIRVQGPRQYDRVGGTSLGGGTLWGLLSLLTGAKTFGEMLAMSDKGDNGAVDMLVGDIYGAGYSKIGLKSSTIASSFGKVFKMKSEAEEEASEEAEKTTHAAAAPDGNENLRKGNDRFSTEDISRSLLLAISNNIGQIAYLQSEKHGLDNIYFGGSFIRGHKQTINTLSYAIRFWSQGSKKAYFLRHEGYLGSVGAFLKRQPAYWGRKNSFESSDRVPIS